MSRLYSVGYADHTTDSLVTLLVESGVKIVADVRANPVSRKKGFSKRQLESAFGDAGITYRSVRELGIPTSDRKAAMGGASAWDGLLSAYAASLERADERGPAAQALADDCRSESTAIMCLESDLNHCHRKPLSEWIGRPDRTGARASLSTLWFWIRTGAKPRHEDHRHRSHSSARPRRWVCRLVEHWRSRRCVAAGYDFTLVRVHTDEGISGIGQCEAPSLVIQAVVENSMGLKPLLIGEDPREVQRLWQKMYNATGLYGRRRGRHRRDRGSGDSAVGHRRKSGGVPVHRLAWRSFTTTATPAESPESVTPYLTVYPPGDDIQQLRERVQMAVDVGARAVKIEEWPGQFGNVDLKTDVAVIEAAREVLGDERELMIDVQNRWWDVGQALQTIKAIEQFRPYFIEAPLPADNIDGYARLADSTDVRIAVGDWASLAVTSSPTCCDEVESTLRNLLRCEQAASTRC